MTVREAAASTLAVLASHHAAQAGAVADAGAAPLLSRCLGEPEAALRRAAAWALGELVRHGAGLARVVAECDPALLPPLVAMLSDTSAAVDARVRAQAATTLAQTVLHEPELAQEAVDAGLIPAALGCLQASSTLLSSVASMTEDS